MRSLVEISYYEMYMDRCYDLLEPKAKEIMALDDKNGKVQLKGLCLVHVSSMDEFCEIYSIGVQRRKVAHTGLNDVSSRSHVVLVIAVQNGGIMKIIEERAIKESEFKKSLFTLSNIIYALNNNEPRIQFRESKLTKILQDSLGGDSCAFKIACLNHGSYQEAVHTVSLATRSRQIVNYFGSVRRKEIPNESVDMEAKLRAWLNSKGKTKSIQRINGFCSPLRKTPTSLSYSKNLIFNRASIKAKNVESLSLTSKGRNELTADNSRSRTGESMLDRSSRSYRTGPGANRGRTLRLLYARFDAQATQNSLGSLFSCNKITVFHWFSIGIVEISRCFCSLDKIYLKSSSVSYQIGIRAIPGPL
ncbi:hypothetical protein IEQ34_009413 [Dendrobium chrysotoxum]|uniref:Kinesin motor domain-containing protein n=1 Tax=Dendrobium chrysotoxum TaxID=161865 RepID=A0AAV7H1T9_DENCH|nr:hypothetical protein IEQ34_009413 [Dendrobium chrysotoxum]